MFEQSRALFEELGDRRGVADTMFGLSIMSRLLGDVPRARDLADESLLIHRDLEDPFGIHGSLYVVGRAAAEMGELDTARAQFLQTLGIAEANGDRTGIALSLDNMADLEVSGGRPIRAMHLAGAAEAIKESVAGQAPPELVDLPDPRERVRELLSAKEIEAAWEAGRAMTVDQAMAYARAEFE
jgi:hypothetical protein